MTAHTDLTEIASLLEDAEHQLPGETPGANQVEQARARLQDVIEADGGSEPFDFEPPTIWVAAEDIDAARAADDPDVRQAAISHAIRYLPEGHPAEAQLADAATKVHDVDDCREALRKALILLESELPELRPVVDVDVPRDHWWVARVRAGHDRETMLSNLIGYLNIECRYFVDGELASSTLADEQGGADVVEVP